MFLDTFIENSSECIDLADLELEYAVSLEAAYNDAMLEVCQLKYQSLVEGVYIANEGVIDSIKNFFGKLFDSNEKFFDNVNDEDSRKKLDNLKKQSKDRYIAEGISYMLKHPKLAKQYKLIGYDTIFIGGVDIDACACTAFNRAINKIIKDGPNVNGDDVSLNALRTFIICAFGDTNKIKVNKINSLSDYRKALYSHVQYVPMNELYKNGYNGSDSDAQRWLDKMSQKSSYANDYRKSFEENMKIYEKKTIEIIAKKCPNHIGIAYKAVNTVNQASIITITYGQWLNVETVKLWTNFYTAAKNIGSKIDK